MRQQSQYRIAGPVLRSLGEAGRRTEQAFTLVEAMVAMVIAAIFLLSSSFLVSSIGGETSRAEARQRVKDDVAVAISILRSDVENAGTGMPYDVAVQNPLLDLPTLETDLETLAWYTIYDLDANNGPDELYLGGAAIQSGWVGGLGMIVVDDGPNFIDVARIDGPEFPVTYVAGGCNSSGDPYVPGAVCGQPEPIYFNLMGPSGWVYQDPVAIESIIEAPVGDSLRINYVDPGPRGLRTPSPGQVVNFYRNVFNGGLQVVPRSVPMARWYLDQPNGVGTRGTLMRETRFVSPGVNAGDPPTPPRIGNTQTILENVVDFQVSFLVWRCNTGPEWVDHLLDEVSAAPAGDGEFDNNGSGNYEDGLLVGNLARRYLALRGRLLAVRATLLFETNAQATSGDHTFPGGAVGDLTLDNHTILGASLDATREYFSAQYSFDPLNIRLKTPMAGIFPFTPIRDAGIDAQTSAGFGYCRR